MKRLLLGIVALLLSGCGTSKSDLLLDQINGLVEAAKRGDQQVQLNQITIIDWDILWVINPYTQLNSLEKELFADSRIAATKIDERDDVTVLVFTSNNQIVGVVEFPRAIFDFSRLEVRKLTPMDRFKVGDA